jgi:hypothetical protein
VPGHDRDRVADLVAVVDRVLGLVLRTVLATGAVSPFQSG